MIYKLTIEYDGAAYSGWQLQPNRRTVQGDVEAALATILGEPVRVRGASRTDAGVHALGQVATFSTHRELVLRRLASGISSLCRPDAAVVSAEIALPDFDARRDAVGKHYRYVVLNRPMASPLLRHTSWHVRAPLDVEAMRDASMELEGVHDFRGFRAADCERENTIRTINSIEIRAGNDSTIAIHVHGTAFLKNMVRIIAGTLVEAGRGRLGRAEIRNILETGDRTRAGQTAPAHGLTLMEIFYGRAG